MKFNQVDHIADLARIELTDEERERFRDQLSKILEYFQMLDDLNTDKIPTTLDHMESVEMYRMDTVVRGLDLDQILGNAPDIDQDQFRVPPVFKSS